MAKVTKDDLIWLCDQIKTQIEKRVPFDDQTGEGKFLQTNYAGKAVWGDPPIFVDGQNVVTNIYNAINTLSNIVAPKYTEKPYEIGELVIHDNVLYRCKVKIEEAELWNGDHWENSVMADEAFKADEAIRVVALIKEYIEHGEWVTKVNNQSGEVLLYGSNILISNEAEKSILEYIDEKTAIATRAEIQSLFS